MRTETRQSAPSPRRSAPLPLQRRQLLALSGPTRLSANTGANGGGTDLNCSAGAFLSLTRTGTTVVPAMTSRLHLFAGSRGTPPPSTSSYAAAIWNGYRAQCALFCICWGGGAQRHLRDCSKCTSACPGVRFDPGSLAGLVVRCALSTYRREMRSRLNEPRRTSSLVCSLPTRFLVDRLVNRGVATLSLTRPSSTKDEDLKLALLNQYGELSIGRGRRPILKTPLSDIQRAVRVHPVEQRSMSPYGPSRSSGSGRSVVRN